MKIWLTVAESAQYSGVRRDSIYTACDRRELRRAPICERWAIRIELEWIDPWLERDTQGATNVRAPDRSAAQW
jgi:hypothetical protein